MKIKKVIIIFLIIALMLLLSLVIFVKKDSSITAKKLPKPQISEGQRGDLKIDKNINESTIDNYLNRDDSIYMDMRMLKDPGNYESIGGDSYLSGFIKGFDVFPLPYIIPVTNLPKSVGNTYVGKTLFSIDSKGNYVPNYEESIKILKYYFPQDKYIFLICGGGGYAGMMKDLLISLGWNENKIYNVGGYWYYNGKNKVQVKIKQKNKIKYEFWKVPYHEVKFDELTEVSND